MNTRHHQMLQRRLALSGFSQLYDELVAMSFQIQLLLRQFGVSVTAVAPTTKQLEAGEHTRIILAGQHASRAVTVVRGFAPRVVHLSHRMSKFFPSAQRDHWIEVFTAQAFHGPGSIGHTRQGGPIPTPEQDRLDIVRRWQEKRGRMKQEVFASMHGISGRTLRRWEKDLKEQGKL
jgi:hypothetical protein